MSNILLDTKNIGKIKGLFYLPDYQRGYRWTKEEIKLLLNDIYESAGNPYCLQPIVVKKNGDKYELIDGQQRLTTIYLICKYMEAKLGDLYAPDFDLEYETRKESAHFLKKIDMELRDTNIDFHFIAAAYEYIEEYFQEKTQGDRRELAAYLTRLNEYFMSSVSVIWYEVDSSEDGIELFERLNIGKIPLTSSELIKALFLKDSVRDRMSGRQEEVSLQWDNIEHELRNPSFWGFLSNDDGEQIATRIDLILDLIAGKDRNKEKYFTFFHFDQEIKNLIAAGTENPLLEMWSQVYHVFLTLREWYANHDFYHKIGYLIATGTSLKKIYEIWKNGNEEPLAKDDFLSKLDQLISSSIDIKDKDDLLTLSYENRKDKLQNVLTLFNVETERLMDEGKRRFPFDKHKESIWSLEHIHAQNAESLKKNKDILAWLESHLAILKSSDNISAHASIDLIEKMEILIAQLHSDKDPGDVRNRFGEIQEEVISLFTPNEMTTEGENKYSHELANMALLDVAQNAALSNSVFDVKRQRVIEYDKDGRYIPVCTKNVFFKYYTNEDPSLHFWGENDRRDYIIAIDEKISPYYQNPGENIEFQNNSNTKYENNDTEGTDL